MHELSIIMTMTDIIREKLAAEYGEKEVPVEKVAMAVGKLSTVVPDALQFAFETMKKGTIFENAELLIREIPISCLCRACSSSFEIEEPSFHCPRCASPDIGITGGRELFIDSVEVSETMSERSTRNGS
ncbi:MAG: hydrogenase maturation nickel metallochaperone HypA [Candidatus Eremiobacteraeota bacterium]|nr:hydrogenase maturation nickel metallochaperone HypA [Candidatus Eremiobacteraeota bacterium]